MVDDLSMRSGSIIALLALSLFVFGVVMVSSARLTPLRGPGTSIRVVPETGIGVYQDDLSRQADSIFQDEGNPRREPDWEFESEEVPGSSSGR